MNRPPIDDCLRRATAITCEAMDGKIHLYPNQLKELCDYALEQEARVQEMEADNAGLVKFLESLLKYESINWLHGYIKDVIFKNHPGAALLEELEQWKKSDASKEQTLTEYYNRAKEAERELTLTKWAYQLVCADLAHFDDCPYYNAEENIDWPECESCNYRHNTERAPCWDKYYSEKAKAGAADE